VLAKLAIDIERDFKIGRITDLIRRDQVRTDDGVRRS